MARPRRLRRALLTALLLGVLSAALLLLLEGAVNAWGFAKALFVYGEPLAERSHTRYDPLLGWSHVPGLHLADLYGPGKHLTTSAQGFRGAATHAREVPAGRIRVICSGDSFTLGYGVGDAETWCHLLTVLDPRLQTVNMGQGGYGIDQAYLWYERDGKQLDHQIHVFAFINEGFRRMKSNRFVGYPKPRLRLERGAPVAADVPVPEGALQSPLRTQLALAFERLATYRTARDLLLGTGEAPGELAEREVRALALAVFEDLHRSNLEQHSTLVLVYFPILADWHGESSDLLRYFLAAECRARGIRFVDLVEELRRLPFAEAQKLFDWHFSPAGNRFAAERLLFHLQDVLKDR